MKARNWSRLVVAAIVMAGLNISAPAGAGQSSVDLAHLRPGKQAALSERVPINFVFVGFEKANVNVRRFMKELPRRYMPVVRSYGWYTPGQVHPFGINYTYDYDLFFTNKDYEDRFFGRLASSGRMGPATQYQRLYTSQQKNLLDIKKNLVIDAPATERWLAYNPPVGVRTSEYTLYFINWHGRADFRFHVYAKTDEPISDTGWEAWRNEAYRDIAWGGTTPDDPENGLGRLARVWFLDLSAGPEYWSDNWNVDEPDLDGNGSENYRIPPVWEYHKKGYRAPSELSGDLGKVARYVGINLLFTPSPLYPAAITPPLLPDTIDLDLNFYEAQSGVDASEDRMRPRVLVDAVQGVLPFGRISADTQDLPMDDPEHVRCFAPWAAPYSWLLFLRGTSCYPDQPYPLYANMFLHNALNRELRFDDLEKNADYEAGSFNYNMPDTRNTLYSCLAWADDNYDDGTQSFVFSFLAPSCSSRLGFTDLLIHEYGHHISLPHPHDGFDFESRREYSAWWQDQLWFVALGDEVNSAMSYQNFGTNNEFSQFDRDNINRWLTAGYLTAGNKIAKRILADSEAVSVAEQLRAADRAAGRAVVAFSGHEYLTAVKQAKKAYDTLVAAARRLGIEITGDWRGTTPVEEGDQPSELLPGLRRQYAYMDVIDPTSPRLYVPIPHIHGLTHRH